MKKFFISCLFILSGSALWWGLSNTAQYSLKKWDAKFDSVVRHGLTQIGVKNEDLLSSVNQLKSDANGQYVVRRMTVKKVNPSKLGEFIKELEQSGADVKLSREKGQPVLSVQRGSRVYQEITFK